MTPEQRNALESIIATGACAINPPLFGWLLREGVLAGGGFDKVKAQQLLDEDEEK